MPVLGFNSGRYGLNLIHKHYMESLADTRVRVANNVNMIMFLLSDDFRFLDKINYLEQGVSCGWRGGWVARWPYG